MSAIPGKIDNRLVTWDGLKDYHNNFLRAIPKLGNENIVTGLYSFGLGQLNNIEKEYSFGFGYNNTVTGQYSFGFGQNNTVTGDNNFVAGTNLRAFGSQTIFGKNNIENTAIIFAVGNGASSETEARANAFEIDIDSNAIFGTDNEVSGSHNFLVGNHLIAKGNQIIFGQYNQEDENALFMIGSGKEDNLQNIFMIASTGSGWIGSGNYIEDNVSQAWISGNLNQIISDSSGDSSDVPNNSSILNGSSNIIKGWNNSFILGKNNTLDYESQSSGSHMQSGIQGLIGNNLYLYANSYYPNSSRSTLIIGEYNDTARDYSNIVFAIGGGSATERKNLLEIDYTGGLLLEKCYLASSLYDKNHNPLIWTEEGALRHSLFPVQENEGVWAIHKNRGDALHINYRQPFEYKQSSEDNSDADLYKAPTAIVFHAGSGDTYANLYGEWFYGSHFVFRDTTAGFSYTNLEGVQRIEVLNALLTLRAQKLTVERDANGAYYIATTKKQGLMIVDYTRNARAYRLVVDLNKVGLRDAEFSFISEAVFCYQLSNPSGYYFTSVERSNILEGVIDRALWIPNFVPFS